MPSWGMTLRTSQTRRWGLTGKLSSSSPRWMCSWIWSRTSHVVGEVVGLCPAGLVGQASEGVGDVADHLQLGEIDVVDHRRLEVYVDDPGGPLVVGHEERRFFHHVVADVEDQVGALDGAVEVVPFGQGRGAEEQGMVTNRPLPCPVGC